MQNRLKELRKAKGLTQEKLAEITGVSQSHIALLESNRRGLSFDNIEVFAKALGVKPYELLPLEWQPEPITPAEQQILDMIRKTATPDNTQSETSKAE